MLVKKRNARKLLAKRLQKVLVLWANGSSGVRGVAEEGPLLGVFNIYLM